MQKAPKSKPATNSAKVGPRQDHPSRPRTSFEEKWLEQITEDSCCLSNLDRHYRGKMRLRIQSSPDVKVLAHVKWFQRVGLLPQSPCMILGYGGRSRKNRAALERRWLHILDERQRDAWRELSPDHQNQYLRTGLITLGVTKQKQSTKVGKRTGAQSESRTTKQTPLSNVPISHILRKIKEAASEKWDYNAIDWSST